MKGEGKHTIKVNKRFYALLSFLLIILLIGSTASAEGYDCGSSVVYIESKVPCIVFMQIGDHGKVTADSADYSGEAELTADIGTAVTYIFTPDPLYEVDKVIYNGADVTSQLSSDRYTAPALAGHASLSVCFRLPGGKETESYTVTFDANGHGTAPAAKTVLSGNKVSKPSDPASEGYTFEGWYTDRSCTEKYDFNSPVEGNITLYAKWTEKTEPIPADEEYMVMFSMSGHGTQVPAQKVKSGEKAVKPSDPAEEGYTFEGWYSDPDFTSEYRFNTSVKSNITLYAKWTKNTVPVPEDTEFTVTLDISGDGLELITLTVKKGEKLPRPSDPEKNGYIFRGWYSDRELTEEYDFEAPVEGSITLYAKWEQKENGNGNDADPKTGDDSDAVIWIIVAAAAACALVCVIVISRKKDQHK